jgi:two-component system, chemotaxis family, protein-glutamate methylesterase/glutaminase
VAGARRSRVLVVDDSATARSILSRSLRGEPDIDVVAEAADAFSAMQLITQHRPDVITLDLELPQMDGLAFLRLLMRQDPLPVIVVSSHTTAGSALSIEALRAGAIDVITKPRGATEVAEVAGRLKQSIRDLRNCPVRVTAAQVEARLVSAAAANAAANGNQLTGVIAIGASTGGPRALEDLLMRLPKSAPPVLIVQHMPAPFMSLFAKHLDNVCPLHVVEAMDRQELKSGTAYVAAGDHHLLVEPAGLSLRTRLNRSRRVHHQRPSVDVLFRSLAAIRGVTVVGVLLTGMGEDGAEGMVALRQAGHPTIAQDERSCTVFGMPREAIRRGGAGQVVALDHMAKAIFDNLDVHPLN